MMDTKLIQIVNEHAHELCEKRRKKREDRLIKVVGLCIIAAIAVAIVVML